MPTTAWKMSEYRVFSGPYFPAFGLNAEISSINPLYSVRIQEDMDQKKLRVWTLLAHGKNYRKTTGSLCNYYRDIYLILNLLNTKQVLQETLMFPKKLQMMMVMKLIILNMMQPKLVKMKLKLLFH